MATFSLGTPQPVSDVSTTVVADCVHATALSRNGNVALESPILNSRHFTPDELCAMTTIIDVHYGCFGRVSTEESLQLLTCYTAIVARDSNELGYNELRHWCELIAASWLYTLIVNSADSLDVLSSMNICDLFEYFLEVTALDREPHAFQRQQMKFSMLCICFHMKTHTTYYVARSHLYMSHN